MGTFTMAIESKAGFCFVATGDKYRDEAAQAARYVRKTNPDRLICLISDVPVVGDLWDDVVILEKPAFGFRDKIAMGLCPYARFLYLDTDTMVVSRLDGVFDLLNKFDMVGCQLFEGHDYRVEGIPDCFPDFCGGVLGFRRSARITEFFENWAVEYDRFRAENTSGYYHPANTSDQKSLRYSVYFSDLRHSVLPPEFNFIPQHLAPACLPVSIFHGRPIGALEALEPRMNAKLGIRAYVPLLDAVIGGDPPITELRRIFIRVTAQILRRVVRRILPRFALDWLRRFKLVRHSVLAQQFETEDPSAGTKWQ
jgi:hypothetical protein